MAAAFIIILIGLATAIGIIAAALRRGPSEPGHRPDGDHTSDDDSGPGFYLSKLDAMRHGAMFKLGRDKDGPGFYM